jgi:hypothetical protein
MKSIFIVILFFLSSFSDIFVKISGMIFFAYFDEILLAFIFINFLYQFTKKEKVIKFSKKITIAIVLFSATTIFVGKNDSYLYSFIQILIHLKLYFLIYYLYSNLDIKSTSKILKLFFTLIIIGFILNLYFGENFNNYFDIKNDYRANILNISGFQLNRNTLGLTLLLLAILIYKQFEKNRKKLILYITIISILILFTGSRTTLMILVITSVIIFYSKQSKKLKGLAIIIIVSIIVPFGYFIKDTEYINLTNSNMKQINSDGGGGYIRGIMIYHGFQLANQFFPFGSGAATYGTVLSEGSIVYKELGIDNYYFLKEFKGVYDSNLASIVGEFGYLGLLLFLILTYSINTDLELKDQSNKKYILIVLLLILIYTVTAPILMSSNMTIILGLTIHYLINSKATYSDFSVSKLQTK